MESFDMEAERAAVGVEVAYTTAQVARIFGVCPTTIRRAIRLGELQAVRIGGRGGYRITRAACRDWMRDTGRFLVLS